jgi:hypothetical protein
VLSGAADLTLLALAGLAIAAIGALGPATWAAASRIRATQACMTTHDRPEAATYAPTA